MSNDRTGEQQTGTFADFNGYEGDEDTDATADHDEWGVADDVL